MQDKRPETKEKTKECMEGSRKNEPTGVGRDSGVVREAVVKGFRHAEFAVR
jgi:hypothetical protein